MPRNSIAKNYVRNSSVKQRVIISPTASSSLDAIAKQLQHLNELELEEVGVMVAALLTEARRQPGQPEEDSEVDEMGGANEAQRRGIGHIEIKMIPDRGKLYGPYRYLRYWSQGRLKSRYLGK